MGSQFKEGEFCKIVYTPTKLYDRNADNVSTTHKCPGCGCEVWKASHRAGTKKQMTKLDIKFKCRDCGLWFITKEEVVEKCLGVVRDNNVQD